MDPEYDARYFEEDVGESPSVALVLPEELIVAVDLEIFAEGVKFLRSLADTAPLRDMVGASRMLHYPQERSLI